MTQCVFWTSICPRDWWLPYWSGLVSCCYFSSGCSEKAGNFRERCATGWIFRWLLLVWQFLRWQVSWRLIIVCYPRILEILRMHIRITVIHTVWQLQFSIPESMNRTDILKHWWKISWTVKVRSRKPRKKIRMSTSCFYSWKHLSIRPKWIFFLFPRIRSRTSES